MADFWKEEKAPETPRPTYYAGPHGLRLMDAGENWGPGKSWYKHYSVHYNEPGGAFAVSGYGDTKEDAAREWLENAQRERARLAARLDELENAIDAMKGAQ